MKSSSAAVKVTDPVRGGTFRLKVVALCCTKGCAVLFDVIASVPRAGLVQSV